MRKKIVAGNWKMNKTLEEGIQLVDEIIKEDSKQPSVDVFKIIVPPSTHLASIAKQLRSVEGFYVGAQNCHQASSGAYTGEVSAKMVVSTGASYVILGHSERRHYFGENNELLAKKTDAALKENLKPIYCVGEKLEERNNNTHFKTVKQQLEEVLFHLHVSEIINVVIAYEPVWAIGTGITATTVQAQEMHAFIRSEISDKYGKESGEVMSILYGGSCNALNAKDLFACADVDGGLIGGASLNASDFITISNSF
jgi:triosephosphate isomerase